MLCNEPFNYRPWEVGRLTPFQVRAILFAERTKDGSPQLDPPLGDVEPVEVTMESEFRDQFRRDGVTDPDALDLLVRQAVDADAAAWSAMAIGAEGD